MKEKYIKGLVHGFLALLAFSEVAVTKGRLRKMLVGAAAGWHSHSCFYHFILEKDKSKEQQEWEATLRGWTE